MNILITGGTGFIGSRLCETLLKENHTLVVKTRQPNVVDKRINAVSDLSELGTDAVFDVVINLAGEPIADKRWSTKQKEKILRSRLDITEELISYFIELEKKPALFISGSAIGFYGIESSPETLNTKFDESALGDSSFASRLCQQWEASALQADALGIRTCLLRTGIVLGQNGGALSKMLLPFKLGLGGAIGSGNQWMPWIHIDDLIGLISFCISQPNVSGAINGTAPNPVTNSEFTKALGKALKRPTVLPMPGFMVKTLMGQMGRELLLAGKRVVPTKALDAGYCFKFDTIDEAMSDLFG